VVNSMVPCLKLTPKRSQRPHALHPAMIIVLLLAMGVGHARGHQDPCHRLHSCPSDHGTYVCGDRGRCDQCPDNSFLLTGSGGLGTVSTVRQ
jgi:hypothetical protein